MQLPVIGISIGDPNGIGPEVVLKSLEHPSVLKLLTPVIYAPAKFLATVKNQLELTLRFRVAENEDDIEFGHVNVIECGDADFSYEPGQSTSAGGKMATASLEKAIAALKSNEIDALVTAPINKSNMPKEDFPYPGHTEFLTAKLEATNSLMFLVNDALRVGLVTNHVPVSEIAANISKQAILDKLEVMDTCLRRDFAIEKPLIALLALNPHAGDNGVIGDEDDKIIRPAILEAKKKGMLVLGPYPADGFFGSGKQDKVDAVLAMYHDQGLVPFKALSFGQGVNYTGGLPAIRTSPDHGTAYDIAGKGIADPASFRRALFLAHETVGHRLRYDEDTANPLVPAPPTPRKKPLRGGGKSGGKSSEEQGGRPGPKGGRKDGKRSEESK